MLFSAQSKLVPSSPPQLQQASALLSSTAATVASQRPQKAHNSPPLLHGYSRKIAIPKKSSILQIHGKKHWGRIHREDLEAVEERRALDCCSCEGEEGTSLLCAENNTQLRRRRRVVVSMEMRKRSQRLLPPPFRRTPWLGFAHGKRMKYQIFCSITDQKMYIRSIPEMRRKFCWASCYGWLVMCDLNMTDLFLWNPVSLEKIQLPPLLSLKSIQYNCTLSSPPSDPNCRVFFFGEFDPLVFYCRPGDDKWTEEKCVVGENDSICVAISCNDKLRSVRDKNVAQRQDYGACVYVTKNGQELTGQTAVGITGRYNNVPPEINKLRWIRHHMQLLVEKDVEAKSVGDDREGMLGSESGPGSSTYYTS
ncbi:hypothetical protein HHK36_021966 [Tetracentron sinense]|uniref:KIB1-4 beta-propeller domain-containing protein n=1 Tax=Tetracentron sinense TaxID=13715 RepID=A0A834YTL6_TETSI|nr:hypothetical protein HHK36_021966 [Tetracentron sinense]